MGLHFIMNIGKGKSEKGRKLFCALAALLSVSLAGCVSPFANSTRITISNTPQTLITTSSPLVLSARKQIGVVTSYDSGYYQGGYPPADRGACTDVIAQALLDQGYNLKQKLDTDMLIHPELYTDDYDANINFRRVRNVKIYLDRYAQVLTIKTDSVNREQWKAGDIVTYDQIPGSLWHIAIISDKKNSIGLPLLIHNYAQGVVENDLLLGWPAPITGHYRIVL